MLASLTKQSAPEVRGQRFGNYELVEKIGKGVVYRARQSNLDRVVAVKLLPFARLSSAESVQRFQAEASAAAGLQHPNIVAIHDVGEHEGQHCFSMDFIEGRRLAKELERFLEEKPIQARPVSVAGNAWKGCRRRPDLVGMSTALAFTLIELLGRCRATLRRGETP